MNPTKQLGKIREQVDRENISRRRYPWKWGPLAQKDVNAFYNQNFINDQIRKSNLNDSCPNQYVGSGESYFLSRGMYNSLVSKCRCGRQKTGVHMTKCLQQIKNVYLKDDEDTNSNDDDDDNASGSGKDDGVNYSEQKLLPKLNNIQVPATSNGMIGWAPNRLEQYEKATKYVSPKYTMPGYKIDDHPYNCIFIG